MAANHLVLQEFTGNSEAVLTAHTPEVLMKMIQFVSVRSSEIGSRSANIENNESSSNSDTEESSKQRAMVEEIKTASADESWDDFDDDEW